jgi:hypothetical protein
LRWNWPAFPDSHGAFPAIYPVVLATSTEVLLLQEGQCAAQGPENKVLAAERQRIICRLG